MKKLLAIVVGLVGASAVILVFEFFGELLFPTPNSIDISDVESLKENLNLIPIGSMVFVILAHFLGIISGMVITTYVTRSTLITGYIVGGILILATLINLFSLPHPVWFFIVDIAAVLVSFGLGHKLSKNRLERLDALEMSTT